VSKGVRPRSRDTKSTTCFNPYIRRLERSVLTMAVDKPHLLPGALIRLAQSLREEVSSTIRGENGRLV
jgi:hypothetical protein